VTGLEDRLGLGFSFSETCKGFDFLEGLGYFLAGKFSHKRFWWTLLRDDRPLFHVTLHNDLVRGIGDRRENQIVYRDLTEKQRQQDTTSDTSEESLLSLAYRAIKRKILDLTYPPGVSLSEASLAKELDMSRMPVRLAVKQLVSEGWMEADFRKKIRVRKITTEDVREIYQIRNIIEREGLKKIFDDQQTWEASFRLEEIVVRVKAAQKDLFEWECRDTQFHAEIVKALKNRRIDRFYQSNREELIRIGMMSEKSADHVEQTIAGMYRFVQAVREGSFMEAWDILRTEHLEAGLEMALKKAERD
jgi:DNA-binding GntR family transcriptional regulator